MEDFLDMIGQVHIERHNAAGELCETRDVSNLVTNAGRNWLWNAGNNAVTPAKMGWMALGTNPAAANVADTALGAEISLSRVVTSTNGTITTTQSVWTATYAPGVATGAITEAGIFNNSAGGTMLAHVVFGTLTKNAGDTITVTWTITLS